MDIPEKSIIEHKKFERHLNDSFCKHIESMEVEMLKHSLVKINALYYDGEPAPKILSVSAAIPFA